MTHVFRYWLLFHHGEKQRLLNTVVVRTAALQSDIRTSEKSAIQVVKIIVPYPLLYGCCEVGSTVQIGLLSEFPK